METTIAAFAQASRRARITLHTYVVLLKPRVMSLVVFTAAVGLIVSPSRPSAMVSLLVVLLIALGAGAAGALNMWWDADIDAIMRRTRARPVPRGRVTPRAAMLFGFATSLFSVTALWWLTNTVAAALLAFTIFFYIVIYTIWLKRRTPQNIVIGGAAGALPPLVGWAAATGEIGWPGISMFLLIFMWTPPHFWSLSLFMNDDYQRAGIPMLTVTHGRPATRRHIMAYTILLALTATLPLVFEIGGPIYGVTALVMNLGFLRGAWQLMRRDEDQAKRDHYKAERAFFRYSLWYLFLHFSALVGDVGLSGWSG